MKRLFSLVLCFILILPFQKGRAIDERDALVKQRIQYMLNHCFASNDYFTLDGKPARDADRDCRAFYVGRSCAAFAFYAYYYLFGTTQHEGLVQLGKTSDIDNYIRTQLRPGDIVCTYNKENDEHWMVVSHVDKNEGIFYAYEGNFSGDNEPLRGRVHIDYPRSASLIKSDGFKSINIFKSPVSITKVKTSWDLPVLSFVSAKHAYGNSILMKAKMSNPSHYPVIWDGYYLSADIQSLNQPENRHIRIHRKNVTEFFKKDLRISYRLFLEEGKPHYFRLFASGGREQVMSSIYVLELKQGKLSFRPY